jgi:hypothetical protein
MVRHTLMALALVGTVGAAVPAVASAASTDRPAVTITIHRVYDPYRRDYHVWNRRERRSTANISPRGIAAMSRTNVSGPRSAAPTGGGATNARSGSNTAAN